MLSIALLIAAQTTFSMPVQKDYDSAGPGGIKFGITADKDLKKMFKVGKGAIRPEALVIGQDEKWRYDALLNGRGGDAKAIAVWAEARRAIELSELNEGLDRPEVGFVRDRSSDWAVNIYPAKGIAIVTTMRGPREYVDGVLLTSPDYTTQLARTLEPRATQILDLRQIFDSKDRRVYLRSFSLTLSSKNISIDRAREERLLESFAERRAETRDIRFGGRDGSITVSVSIDFDKTTVSASLSGRNEVGEISGSGSSSARKFSVKNDVPAYRRDYVEDAVIDALDQALYNADRAIQAQRPPTEEEDRRRLILALLNTAIK
jgi:hypothetical protein